VRYNNYQSFDRIHRQAGKIMMMIIVGYFSIAFIVFCVWFISFLNDTSTSKKDLKSWIILLMGPLIWPVVLPLSYLQLNVNKKAPVQAKSDRESEEILEGND
jgi:polyferredoxin